MKLLNFETDCLICLFHDLNIVEYVNNKSINVIKRDFNGAGGYTKIILENEIFLRLIDSKILRYPFGNCEFKTKNSELSGGVLFWHDSENIFTLEFYSYNEDDFGQPEEVENKHLVWTKI